MDKDLKLAILYGFLTLLNVGALLAKFHYHDWGHYESKLYNCSDYLAISCEGVSKTVRKNFEREK